MKVLFISSGNSIHGISPLVKRQGESLSKAGIEIFFFTIKGKGFIGYLSNLWRLKKILKEIIPDIIHAHYAMSAFLATLAGCRPLIVSLMGSDVKRSALVRSLIKLHTKTLWCQTIVKSVDMRKSLKLNNIEVIPNGIDISIFYPIDKQTCLDKLGWSKEKRHLLFGGDPSRAEKNYSLALKAFLALKDDRVEIHALINVPSEIIPLWINASDVVLLTSFWEGSPNVIKEAMACNCPAVSTNVGDVEHLFQKVPGYFIAGFTTEDLTRNIKEALDFAYKFNKTNGRQKIIDLGLDSEKIAFRIIEVYKEAIRIK